MARESIGYSWKKPWAFTDLRSMNRTLTTSEVYRRLQVIERHSAFEKPYRMPDHKLNQLIYQGPGWGYPGKEPLPDEGGQCGHMACLAGFITCGGCEEILYVCAKLPLTCMIKHDPTGKAWINQMAGANRPMGRRSWQPARRIGAADPMPDGRDYEAPGVTAIVPQVCLPDDTNVPNAVYWEIVVECCDDSGMCCELKIPITGCPGTCCEDMVISGPDTTNPGVQWTGQFVPDCQVPLGSTCSVTSNSGCSLSCSLNSVRSAVVVTPGANACGSFTVTVNVAADPANGCPARTASKTVRINNTGQGGAWTLVDQSTVATCNACSGCVGQSGNCIVGEFRIGSIENNEGPWSCQGFSSYSAPLCSGDSSNPPPLCAADQAALCPAATSQSGGQCNACVNYSWGKWEWKCTC